MKELERSLGLVGVVAISVSAMLGSGIFVLPGMAASRTGPSVWLAYLLAGLAVLPAATCKAELATAMPTSGGSYVYLDRIFGPFFGTVAGTALWLSLLLKSAFALIGFGAYLAVFGDVPTIPTALAFLVVVVLLNVVGIRNVSRAQVGVVAIALAGLLGLVIRGAFTIEPVNLENELAHGVGGLFAAAGFVFVSYNGVTKVAAIAEEVQNPQRNLPLGILISLFLVMGVYALVAFVLVGNVPWGELTDDLRPIHTLATRLGGPWLGWAVAALGVLTMISMANAGLLAASRFPFAMSRERLLPSRLARVHERFRTPVASIVLTGLAMAAAVAFLDVERMAKLASAIVIIIYVAESTAVIIFRVSRVQWYRPTYWSPFFPWLQSVGILAGLALLLMLGWIVLAAIAVVGVLGAAPYVLYGRARADRHGVVYKRGRRGDLVKNRPVPLYKDVCEVVEGDTGVVVALFGMERSPEMLVEVGIAIASGSSVEVLDLQEVPDQTGLDAMVEEEPPVQSRRRRIGAMAEEKHADIRFHPVATRDLAHTVYTVTGQVRCAWLVIQWEGRGRRSLLPYNPIGWLINHLHTNLALYKDTGVRYVREILVYPEPGPHDALVLDTADHLAAVWDAHITLVRFVPLEASQTEVDAEADYLTELQDLCVAPSDTKVVRAKSEVSAIAKETSSADLLVMGSAPLTLWRALRGSPQDRITAEAACSVLTVKTPQAQRPHEAIRRRSIPPPPSFILRHVDERVLGARVHARRKEVLFEHFALAFASVLEGVSAGQIEDALWKRERSQNTAVGRGMALPHGTLHAATRSVLGVFTVARPIDYGSEEYGAVDVFFVTCGPPSHRQTHLQLLSSIARLTMETDVLDRLRSAPDESELLAVLEGCCSRVAA